MKDEYISRQAAIDTISMDGINCHEELVDIWAIECIPAADVVPVVHAYWRDTGSGQECSVCKEIQYGYDTGRYFCANCGAKMDGERQE